MKDLENVLKQIRKSNFSQEQKDNLEQSALKSNKAGVPIILNTYQLSNVLGIKWKLLKKVISDSQKMYYDFNISKRGGGKRKISMPNEVLKAVQMLIKEKILENIKVMPVIYT